MKFQIGHVELDKVTDQTIIHQNKARKYLLPCLREYGEDFTNKLNSVYKVAVGLGDMVITRRFYKAPERHLFILLDSKIAPHHFEKFINWIRQQEMFEDDYVYGNIQKSHYHMVIIKFPKKFWDSFEAFNKGKYSEMFDAETIKNYFVSKDNENAPKVLIKDKNYKVIFTRKLNRLYGTQLNSQEYEGELDLPPQEIEENFD